MTEKLTKRQLQSLKRHFETKERRGELKEAQRERQQQRSQRRKRPPRRRDWQDGDDAPSYEKMRPASAADLPASAPPPSRELEAEPGLVGTVIEVRSGDSLVAVRGRTLRAILPPAVRVSGGGMRSPLAVGDRVALEPADGQLTRVATVLPRRSALIREVYDPSRRDPNTKGQVLAANIDLLVIVCSPVEPPFRARLIDRYLVAASRDGLPALVCLNKTDLGVPEAVASWLRYYESLGAATVETSAATGDIAALRDSIAGKVSLFSGHSGVGKTSLLNAIEPGLALRVGAVTQAAAGQGKGRHTTSSARLVPLSLSETFVVDSPGIRAFGLRGMPPSALVSHLPDLAAHAHACAYRDCRHAGEPDCAVELAARNDPFLRDRLASYRTMRAELA